MNTNWFVDLDTLLVNTETLTLLKSHTRLETFHILLKSLREQTLNQDRMRLDDARTVAGLSHYSSSALANYKPKEGEAPLTMDDYVPALLDLSRRSPYPEIRAIAVNTLPNLDSVGALYGAPDSLPDPVARMIYTVKLGDQILFRTLVKELQEKAKTLKVSFFLQIPPCTITYLIDSRGPCLEDGPGVTQGQRTALREDELYSLLRISSNLPGNEHCSRVTAIVGDWQNRKWY